MKIKKESTTVITLSTKDLKDLNTAHENMIKENNSSARHQTYDEKENLVEFIIVEEQEGLV